MQFIITDKEGSLYSSKSGDYNSIHLDDLTGYNSIFGHKVCHGSLVFQKSLKLLKLDKKINLNKKFYIEISFLKHFTYNERIKIEKKNLEIFQQNGGSAFLKVRKNTITEDTIKYKKKKYLKINYKVPSNNFQLLCYLLDKLSYYVGMIYPGKFSIINDIKIDFDNKFKFNKNKICIYSQKLDKKFPIINNKLLYKNFKIHFTTSERPNLILKKSVISKDLKNKIIKIDKPVLIIGASSGIGLDLFKILSINKKIPIIITFNKNKIYSSNKNVQILKLDLLNDISILKTKLKKFDKIRIYYFSTSKIELKSKSKKKIMEYKKFYINFPVKILSAMKNKRIEFFYFSSIYVNKINSSYSKIKKLAENTLAKYQSKRCKINFIRLGAVNTKQNLSLIKKNLPNFSNLLNKNLEYQKKIFFE